MNSVFLGFPGGSAGKESPCNAGYLGWEDPLEKGKTTHSSILPNTLILSLAESFSQATLTGHLLRAEDAQ